MAARSIRLLFDHLDVTLADIVVAVDISGAASRGTAATSPIRGNASPRLCW